MAVSDVIARLAVSLEMETAAFEKGATLAEKRMSQTQRKLDKLGKKMTSVGKTMSLTLTAPIAAFGVMAVRTAGDFEQAMNNVGAVSGATVKELEGLRDIAKEMGRTTQFTASQAAEALSFLSMAGFDAQQSMDALPGTLQLAASAQMDLGRAADIVSNVLTGYGKDVSELAHVNDVLVKTFTSANTDLAQLGEALKYAGPVASAAGVRFEEASAAIALMGNAGIQGTMAGTSLRGAMSRLLSPTAAAAKEMARIGFNATDAEGKLLPLADIVEQLGPHADDAGMFMRLFGQRAGPAMAALVSQGSDALRELDSELQNAGGTAERISAAQMEGFNGAMKRLQSAFEGLQIALAESGLLDFLASMAEGLATGIQKLSEFSPTTLKVIAVIGALVAAVGPVIWVMGSMVGAVSALLPVLAALGPVLTAVRVALLAIAMNPIILGLAAVIGGIYLAWKNWDKIEPIVRRLYNAVKNWVLDKLGAVWDSVMSKINRVKDAFRFLYDAVVGNSYVPDMVDGIGRHMQRLDAVMVAPAEDATAKVGAAFASISGLDGTGATAGIPGALEAIGGAANDNADRIENANVRIAKSFKDMADDTLSALGRLTNAIKSGGFLGILEAVIGLGLQLGSVGAFGKKLQTRINSTVPAYANGTSFHPGGLAVVGERGPELVSMPRGSRVYPNGMAPVQRVEIVDTTGLFRFAVNGQIMEAAPGIAQAGSTLSQARMTRRDKWRLA